MAGIVAGLVDDGIRKVADRRAVSSWPRLSACSPTVAYGTPALTRSCTSAEVLIVPSSHPALAALVVLLLGLIACGGDEPMAVPDRTAAEDPAGTPTPAPEPVEDPHPTPATPAPGGTGGQEPACTDPRGCYGTPERIGEFDAAVIPGASGLAASRRNPGVLYLLDDRPGTAEVWAVQEDGSMLGAIGIAGLDALDTESLAVGRCGPSEAEPCLYVGDIGDNLRSRRDIVVHRVVEPDLSAGVPADPLPSEVARLRYPGEAHDAEALLVDDAGTMFIVTKARFDRDARATGETRLYRAEGFADGLLTDLGPLEIPEPSAPMHSLLVGNVVTGADHRDGRVLLRTYDQVLELIAPDPAEPDLAGLASWPAREVPSAIEPQSEAITWAADGCGYLTVSEMVGDIWYVPCLP